MKVGVLQQFLRSLVPAIEAADGRMAGDLNGAITAFEPFRSLDVNAFAAFLNRAKEYQDKGAVAVPTPGQQQIDEAAKALQRLNDASDSIPDYQQSVAAALQSVAVAAGLKGKLTADPKWAEARVLQVRLAPHRKALFELADRIASPEAFEEPVVREGISQLAQNLEASSLKALAGELGIKVTAKAVPAKTLADVLAKLSGHQPPKAKPKPKAAAVDPAVVDEHSRRLKSLIERSLQADAVSEIDVEAEVVRLKPLSPAALYEVVSRAGISEARPSENRAALLKRVRQELTAARRARERAEV